MYAASEEYRFFLKKLKYQEELVYEDSKTIDDVVKVPSGWDSSSGWSTRSSWDSNSDLTFLDNLAWTQTSSSDEEELPEMTISEEEFIKTFWTFSLKKLETHTNIFGITTEYPDPYHEWYSAGVSVYVLSTKNYEEVRNIFQVLAFDLPYTLNEVNNVWDKSFYINLDEWYGDDYVRIVLEHENNAFWLKIRKDRYNESKRILDQL